MLARPRNGCRAKSLLILEIRSCFCFFFAPLSSRVIYAAHLFAVLAESFLTDRPRPDKWWELKNAINQAEAQRQVRRLVLRIDRWYRCNYDFVRFYVTNRSVFNCEYFSLLVWGSFWGIFIFCFNPLHSEWQYSCYGILFLQLKMRLCDKISFYQHKSNRNFLSVKVTFVIIEWWMEASKWFPSAKG